MGCACEKYEHPKFQGHTIHTHRFTAMWKTKLQEFSDKGIQWQSRRYTTNLPFVTCNTYRLSVFRWSHEILRQLPTNKANNQHHRISTQSKEDQKASSEQTVSQLTSVEKYDVQSMCLLLVLYNFSCFRRTAVLCDLFWRALWWSWKSETS
jgi:hypothetical protein